MADQDTAGQNSAGSATPRAVKKPKGRFNFIWAIPIVAALAAAFLAYRSYAEKGPVITIEFENADGIEAGKSLVKFKDVALGTVQEVKLSEDFSKIILKVQMDREAAPYLSKDTEFWVVSPRISAGGISGLDTIISGTFVGMSPKKGEPRKHFKGLEDPPVITSDVPGTSYLLEIDTLGAVSGGSPIFFKGLDVGTVLGHEFDMETQKLHLHAFVRAPYDKLVTDHTRFWDASGISVNFGSGGVSVKMESIETLLAGGVEFAEFGPDYTNRFHATESRKPAPKDSIFTLYDSKEAADEAQFYRIVKFRANFESVNGLAPGAAVKLQGIDIGTVTDVSLELDREHDKIFVPVTFEIKPQHIVFSPPEEHPLNPDAVVEALVKRGLRAQLTLGNLLSGSQIVSLEFQQDAAPAEAERVDGMMVIPTIPGEFESIQHSVNSILKKINDLPLDKTVAELNSTIEHVDDIVSSVEVKRAVADLSRALKSLEDVTATVDREIGPLLKSLNATAAAADKLVVNADQGAFNSDSILQRELRSTLNEISDAARAFRVLSTFLEEHPEALIQGKSADGD